MSRWYRAYEGTVTDAKLAEVAMVAGCSRSVVIATWHAVLENAATVNDGGRVDIPSRRIAAILCEPFDVIETVMMGFETVGILHDSSVAAWKKRQYESDNSTERSRKHRERKGNVDATAAQRCATPPETETETETEKKNNNGAHAFSGRVIRLTKADYGRWQKAFPGLDLRALLTSRDDWLADRPEPERKKWFQSTSAWLGNRQQETSRQAKVDPMENFIV